MQSPSHVMVRTSASSAAATPADPTGCAAAVEASVGEVTVVGAGAADLDVERLAGSDGEVGDDFGTVAARGAADDPGAAVGAHESHLMLVTPAGTTNVCSAPVGV